jgi:hypothetical protein
VGFIALLSSSTGPLREEKLTPADPEDLAAAATGSAGSCQSPQFRSLATTRAEAYQHWSFVVVRISHALVVLAVLLVLGQMLSRHLRGADLHLLAVSSAVGEGRSARGD